MNTDSLQHYVADATDAAKLLKSFSSGAETGNTKKGKPRMDTN
jgi:hypothetical protein